MKEKHTYVCEGCNTEYADAEMAKECEKSHIQPKKSKPIKMHYHSAPKNFINGKGYEKQNNYPDWIEFEMEDGVVVRYIR